MSIEHMKKLLPPKRQVYTDEELEQLLFSSNGFYGVELTADETARLRAINERRAQGRQAWSAIIFRTEQPLVEELRAAGFDVSSAWGLFNRKEPWRKDVPIPPWPEAVPILIEHLGRPYPIEVREGIVRALTARFARDAVFDRLVEEFRRTAGPQVAAGEQRRTVELVMGGASDFYTRAEVEKITAHHWDSYRFALANAIAYHFEQAHIPLMVELIRDATDSREDLWKALADTIRKKMRRWRRKDAELLALLESP